MEWTNPYGFRTSLILAQSTEINGAYVQIFAPLLSSQTKPQIVLTGYSGGSTRDAIYEFRRAYVKR